MPNSVTVFPNVLPGNVTIGGNLTVTGDQLRIGAAAPFVRLGKNNTSQGFLSQNLGFDVATRDNNSLAALQHTFDAATPSLNVHRINNLGTDRFEALLTAIFTDYVQHLHTGTVTEDTIYSKLIPASTLGANGALRIHVRMRNTVQGGVGSTLRLRLGGVLLLTPAAVTTTDTRWFDAYVYNANATNSQLEDGLVTSLAGNTVSGTTGTSAVDTTADQTLTVTIQNGAGTDAQVFEHISVHQLNSFGPV